MNLNKLFQYYCKINNLEINPSQLGSIEELNLFYTQNFNKSFLKKYLLNKIIKQGFIYKVMWV